MVDYLVYASIRDSKCNEDEINKILESANKNNKKLNITGVLLYTNNRFIQYLEGEKEVIYDLYEKIKKDQRHRMVTLFGINERPFRIFPNWAMAGKDANETKLLTKLTNQEREIFDSILKGSTFNEDRAMKVIHKLAA